MKPCVYCGRKSVAVNPFTGEPFCGCVGKPKDDMSERRYIEMQIGDDCWVIDCGPPEKKLFACVDYRNASQATAALNQPAPCGPELTEEERLALKNASTSFAAEATELSMSGYSKSAALHREWYETIDNLLTRDAKADTVTVRRGVLRWLVMNGHMHCKHGKVYEAIAEAEAALAKGGNSWIGMT